MRLESIMVPALNKFASLYIEQAEPVKEFFHYDLTKEDVYLERYNEVIGRNFDRESLTTCIKQYMERYTLSDKVMESLNKLNRHDSVVVIGGQQAGLLTGPLYTIHKIISIIQLAKQQEEKLAVPVVPVFWIAGEDHDFLEINHVYTKSNEKMKKHTYVFSTEEKTMISHMEYDKNHMKKWMESVVKDFGEKEYTKSMLEFLHTAIESNHTYTEFFTDLVNHLFKNYGLLLIDSANEGLRQLEKDYFIQMVDKHAEITRLVDDQQQIIQQFGFKRTIEMAEHAANLFYTHENERLLLEYDINEDTFVSKGNEVRFIKDELLDLINRHPERFSNNVVTRPIMQELLFPTLAFIAGPGEIAYWGELKQAFELFEINMPIITPRLNITLVDAASERDMEQLHLSLEQILKNQLADLKQQFIEEQLDNGFSTLIDQIAAQLEKQYEEIFASIQSIDQGLMPLTRKNLAFHKNQLEFLERKVEKSILNKHEVKLNKYQGLESFLYPEGSFQERMWNLFYFINRYGFGFVDDLTQLNYSFDGKHQIVKL